MFTIHAHHCLIDQLETWQQRNLLGVLGTCPNETLDDKRISPSTISSWRSFVAASFRKSNCLPKSANEAVQEVRVLRENKLPGPSRFA